MVQLASEPTDGHERCKCQVEGCPRFMDEQKPYFRRYRVCEVHLRELYLNVNGTPSRFCQQCGKFEDVSGFDGTKRSCRDSLKRHSARRLVKKRSSGGAKADTGPAVAAASSGWRANPSRSNDSTSTSSQFEDAGAPFPGRPIPLGSSAPPSPLPHTTGLPSDTSINLSASTKPDLGANEDTMLHHRVSPDKAEVQKYSPHSRSGNALARELSPFKQVARSSSGWHGNYRGAGLNLAYPPPTSEPHHPVHPSPNSHYPMDGYGSNTRAYVAHISAPSYARKSNYPSDAAYPNDSCYHSGSGYAIDAGYATDPAGYVDDRGDRPDNAYSSEHGGNTAAVPTLGQSLVPSWHARGMHDDMVPCSSAPLPSRADKEDIGGSGKPGCSRSYDRIGAAWAHDSGGLIPAPRNNHPGLDLSVHGGNYSSGSLPSSMVNFIPSSRNKRGSDDEGNLDYPPRRIHKCDSHPHIHSSSSPLRPRDSPVRYGWMDSYEHKVRGYDCPNDSYDGCRHGYDSREPLEYKHKDYDHGMKYNCGMEQGMDYEASPGHGQPPLDQYYEVDADGGRLPAGGSLAPSSWHAVAHAYGETEVAPMRSMRAAERSPQRSSQSYMVLPPRLMESSLGPVAGQDAHMQAEWQDPPLYAGDY